MAGAVLCGWIAAALALTFTQRGSILCPRDKLARAAGAPGGADHSYMDSPPTVEVRRALCVCRAVRVTMLVLEPV